MKTRKKKTQSQATKKRGEEMSEDQAYMEITTDYDERDYGKLQYDEDGRPFVVLPIDERIRERFERGFANSGKKRIAIRSEIKADGNTRFDISDIIKKGQN